MKIRAARPGVAAISATLAGLLAAGCGGKNKNEGTGPDGMGTSNQQLIPKVDPELCDTSGKQVQTFDLNQDNKPDVWKLYASVEEGGTTVEILTCKQVDYDNDGKKDYVAVYNRRGEMVAEEFDFTFDGRFDAREHYDKKTGGIYMVERDLDHDKKPDTWEKYASAGALESIERDRNGDGKADLWEQYQAGQILAILYDDDFDGKVDRKESARPLASAPAAPSPTSSPEPGEPVDTVEGDADEMKKTGESPSGAQ